MAYCLATSVWAQAAPAALPDPSQELQRQDRQRQELRQRLEVQPWSPSGLTTQTPPHQQLPDEQPCALIDRVVIQGVLFSEALQMALSGVNGDDPPFGRCLGSQGVTLLIQRVQQALVEQGYITSHVHVPEQDLKNGELVLHINEGRLARIDAESSDSELPRWVWAVQEGGILNLRDIEQSSDNLQRLPSLKSKIQIEPGEEPGTSNLVVDMQASRPLRLGLSMDDAGLKTTGKLQGNATLSWDNPLGLGDLAYFIQGQDLGDKDTGPRGSRNQVFHYSVPWGYWLLGATFSDNQYRQTVYGPYESYLYSGTSSHKEISLARVLHRNATSKTTASVKGFVRQSNNYIADLEVLVQRRRTAGWEAGLQHLHYFEKGTLTAQMAYRHGTGAFGAEPAPEELTGQGTGRMHLTTGLLHWAMPLNTDGHPWQYSTQLQWQSAQTRLTPQDRFCLGSRATVRGFDDQQTLCGDRGQLWRQELATGLPAAAHEALPMSKGMQVYAALDAGRTSTPGQDGAYRLSGMAVGFRGAHKVNDAYPLQWDVFVGKPLSRPDSFNTAAHTTGFSLRAEF
ncbi:ShlB/FhaC/HecB family hemolysin secretion/activation protein [Limnohabitans sp.]|uniref:ShlB/FhaC/HecB family hemolysin secretion/activation protein n=1 Tax=Limnohabitans sp. TaxID=1907725 RepID=UPI00286EB8EC|nr:ShlB/FhaC/HecB family hemolysin secretion/activation protein [Limnohabitans sp.]